MIDWLKAKMFSPDDDAERKVEIANGYVLRAGVVASSIVIVVGMLLRARAVTNVGVLLLIATPWIRLILSLGLFVKIGDRVYAGVCAVLLVMMIAGLLVGAG